MPTTTAAPQAAQKNSPPTQNGGDHLQDSLSDPLADQGIKGKPNRTGMPSNLKSGIENLSGMSMDHVKVHYNSPKPAQLNAHAYAQGSNIHLGSGQARHLPHELGHVVQQAQGRVKPTTSVNGMAVNDSPKLEVEADRIGAKSLE